MKEDQKKEFTGVWIPRKVIEDESLTMTEKIIYADIACFEICFKSNESIGERYKLKKSTVSKSISNLIEKGYLESNKKTGEYRQLMAIKDFRLFQKITRALPEKSQSLCQKNRTIDNNKKIIDNNSFSEASSEDNSNSISLEGRGGEAPIDIPPVPPTPQDVPFDNTPINLMPEPIFDSKTEIHKLIYGTPEKKPQKHIAIIGMFIMAKRYKIESKEMLATLIDGRNCKAAKALKAYTPKQIWDTMVYLQKNADFKWTIESVSKYINDLDNLTINKSQPKAFGEGLEIKPQ